MMNLLNALELSAAAALCGGVPCGPCPPEGQECEVVAVRVQDIDASSGQLSLAPRLVAARQALTPSPQVAYLVDGGQESRTVVKVVIQNDNGALQYSDENGTVQVSHNGEAVPADRIQRDGDTVRILDPDGGTLFEFRVARPGHGQIMRLDGAGGATLGDQWVGELARTPRGRIGVYLATTDEAARSENGIESESAVTITEVIEGSPALEAGLQANDIVVRINGQTASEESLRTIIGETEPGHEVTLRIVRGGEPMDVAVRVGASEEVQFDQAFEGVQVDPEIGHFTIEMDDFHDRIGQIQDHLLRIAPEGAWREHVEHLNQLNPELIEELHEKFGEGQEFFQLHVQPFIHGQQQWIEHEGAHGQAIREKVIEALHNAHLNIDEETRARIHEAVINALEGAMSNLHDVDVQVQGDDQPVLFDLMDRGEGGHVMVLPEGGRFRMLQPGEMRFEEMHEVEAGAGSGGDASERLRRLEERLEKLEGLLQQLVERQGGARLP